MRAALARDWRIEPAWILSLGLAATAFSGQWDRVGSPVPVDRVLLFTGFALVLLRAGTTPQLPPIRLRPLHLLLLAVVCYGLASAVWVGSLDEQEPRFALIDRLGLIPFLAFVVGPSAFATAHQRQILVRVLVGLGIYLGATAVLERLEVRALVWPGYILDPAVGIHYGRARGPFVQAEADGLAMVISGVAAAIALASWRSRATRLLAWIAIGLCSLGILLTITRLVWIGAAGGVLVTMAVFPRLRPMLVPTAILGAAALAAALALAPGLQEDVADRFGAQRPVWTRLGTNDAALRMISERPVLGWGWGSFRKESPDYFRTIESVRYSGVGEDVHNAFLSRFVELGLLGGGLWLIAVMLALGGALVRPLTGDAEIYRMGFCVVAVAILAAGLLSPLTTPLPLLAIWLWAGMLAGQPRREPAGQRPLVEQALT